MSGAAITRYLLAQSAAITAVVTAERIYVGDIPQGAIPAIGVRHISGVERGTVAMIEASRFRTDRVQVTVHARTYQSKAEVLELIRTALSPNSGSINGFDVDSILPDGEGPDFDDASARIYERSRDFLVSWRT